MDCLPYKPQRPVIQGSLISRSQERDGGLRYMRGDLARCGFDGRGCATYFERMMKRLMLPLALLPAVAFTALSIVPRACAQTGAQEPGATTRPFDSRGDRGSPAQAGPDDRAGSAPTAPTVPRSRTPRLSPLPADPTPPSPDARAFEEEKDKADAVPAPPPDTPSQRRKALDDLYAHLAATENAQTAIPLAAAIERLWVYSGSDTIDVLMERVLKAVAVQRLDLAEKLANTIVDLEPGYAEGWNRRALVAYLQGDYETALNALTRALAIEPNHFKALDGLAQIMRQQGDKAAALGIYRRLLRVYPYWEGAQEAFDQLKREVEGDGI